MHIFVDNFNFYTCAFVKFYSELRPIKYIILSGCVISFKLVVWRYILQFTYNSRCVGQSVMFARHSVLRQYQFGPGSFV